MNYYLRRWTFIYREVVKPLLSLLGYGLVMALTLYFIWLLFSIVILLDPGNQYNFMP